MSLLDSITAVLPEVRRPQKIPSLKEKLMWTGVVLLIFLVLGHIYPLGVNQAALANFERLEILLGAKIGTLTTAGIGPLVLASIFLQLAVGAGLLKMDLSKPENKKRFQGIQKILGIILSFAEGAIYVLSGYVGVDAANPLFGSIFLTQLFVIFQLALGSIILLYLDEVCQKYGIGSGISLFIAAGVSAAIFIGSFSIAKTGEVFAGLIPRAIQAASTGALDQALWFLPPLIFTVVVFLVTVYAEGMKIELPLSYGMARGIGARYPIKFLYVSNIPVILAVAVMLNIQLVGAALASKGINFLGEFAGGQPIPGNTFAYLTTPPISPISLGGNYQAYLQYILTSQEMLHMLVYGIVLVVLCVIFGWFWIESTNMDAKSVAGQLEKSGLQIPGFRSDPRVIEGVLSRYIPIITVLGSIFVGILAWFADITGALGTGTGILLTVGIVYKFYEELAQQQLFDMYPGLRKIVA